MTDIERGRQLINDALVDLKEIAVAFKTIGNQKMFDDLSYICWTIAMGEELLAKSILEEKDG